MTLNIGDKAPEFQLKNANQSMGDEHSSLCLLYTSPSPRDPTKVTTSELKDDIDAVLAGSTPTVQSTDSIGCSVTWK